VQVAVDVAQLDDLVRAPLEDVDHAMVAGGRRRADLAPYLADLPAELGVLGARLVQGASQLAGQLARAGIVLRRGERGLPGGPVAELSSSVPGIPLGGIPRVRSSVPRPAAGSTGSSIGSWVCR